MIITVEISDDDVRQIVQDRIHVLFRPPRGYDPMNPGVYDRVGEIAKGAAVEAVSGLDIDAMVRDAITRLAGRVVDESVADGVRRAAKRLIDNASRGLQNER